MERSNRVPLVVATGAGISAESGVPTFRGADGLWEGQRPEDVATPQAFRRDPAFVWKFYHARRRNLLGLEPNAGHRAIAAWKCPVITQNIDGLHQLAGSERVIELHGSIWRARCLACRCVGEERSLGESDDVPRCACGGMLRPDIVWFGESLPQDALDQALALARSARKMIVVGTSNLVYPAAMIPTLALDAGAEVIEVNLEETPLSSRATRFIRGKAAEVLGAGLIGIE